MDVNKTYQGIGGVGKAAGKNTTLPVKNRQTQDPAFSQILQDMLPRQDAIRFSAHAQERLQQRRIELQAADLQKITQAMQSAEKKGARSTLMLYRDLALIANVNSKTVITAMSGDDLQDHIFTNIDSAVIVK